MNNPEDGNSVDKIAIVGMAGRFPGAKDIGQFWQNLRDGVESILPFSDEELFASGVDSDRLNDPDYVKAGAILDDIGSFDAAFFGYTPRQAELMDPQQRIFLECAWEALEAAGYDPARCEEAIGVYAGTTANSYLLHNLYPNRERIDLDDLQVVTGNDKDYLASRVSYKLNLTGPSVVVQTACSTSLVAVHQACDALLNGQCDMALAGGVCLNVPQKAGYRYTEGGIVSPDGHCRAFDAEGQGTVFGSGVGIVVLKRMEDALRDGDLIHATILGSAINNDGSEKIGYTAPSVGGQAKVIREAIEVAGVDPATITYVETHGTGTPLGDPIELAALTQAFEGRGNKKGSCAIGSVKTNVGHLNTAAGVAALMKTVLALKHRMIPPSLNFSTPNPKIDFDNGPFYVNTTLRDWTTDGFPRRAGVSSFGVGGTNAHVVIEEPPVVRPADSSTPWHLFVLSAKTSKALDIATSNLAIYLKQTPELNLADAAYTLAVGRKAMNCRRVAVCRDTADAVKILETPDAKRVFTSAHEPRTRPVVFMFTGQGAQYVNMARELHQLAPVFREQVDRCSELLKPHLGLDLRDVIYPRDDGVEDATRRLTQTAITQPALFVIEYALADQFMEWGIQPQAMIGHSIGEYVAACIAGVIGLEDALMLVAARGRLMNQLPGGSMLSVPLSEAQVKPLLNQEISLATLNAPSACVVSGSTSAIEQLEKKLSEQGIEGRRLHTSHAFHSPMMEPILDPFTDQVRKVRLNAPRIPFVSNVTGSWITDEQATNPEYWARHLRHAVRFSDGVGELLKDAERVFLEIGPGETLTSLTKRRTDKAADQLILSSIRHPREQQSDLAFLLGALGKLWLAGIQVDWTKLYEEQHRHRVSLPTYPFERQRYWVEPPSVSPGGLDAKGGAVSSTAKPDVADWFYLPSWKETMPPLPGLARETGAAIKRWLVFADPGGLGGSLVKQLEQQRHDVVTAVAGNEYAEHSERLFTIRPGHAGDIETLLEALNTSGRLPEGIVHLWTVTGKPDSGSRLANLELSQQLGFYSLLHLAQALGRHTFENPLHLWVVSNNLHNITGDENLEPEKATILGPCKTIPQEYTNIVCHCLDFDIPDSFAGQWSRFADHLLAEIDSAPGDAIVAFRGNHRWVPTYAPVRLDPVIDAVPRLRERGVYLITGGLGGIGLVLAEYLARAVKARLILVGRTAIPERAQWEQWLKAHGDEDATSRRIQKVRSLEEMGAEVLVVAADVANLEQMKDAMLVAKSRFGPINGVVHAAGIPGGGAIQVKDPAVAAAVMAPKVRGALVLGALLNDMPVDWMVLCSSTLAITSRFGQVDYCGANAFLDAFAHCQSSQEGTRTISVNWDGWQEVGMAADAVTFGSGTSNKTGDRGKEVGHPLLDRCLVEEADRAVFRTEFGARKHWVLAEHHVGGNAVVPGTAWIEMMRAAYEFHTKSPRVEISEVFFSAPLAVAESDQRQAYAILEKSGDGYDFHVFTRASTNGGGAPAWEEHAGGRIGVLEPAVSGHSDIDEIVSRCEVVALKDTVGIAGDVGDALVEWGPRWQSVRSVYLGKNELLVSLELPTPYRGDLDAFALHPALLDAATGVACQYIGGGTYLPYSYERLSVWDRLPGRIFAHAKFDGDASGKGQVLSLDVRILDEQGKLLVEIKGLTFVRSRGANAPVGTAVNSQPRNQGDSARVRGERARYYESLVSSSQLPRGIEPGILSSQGVDAFRRILARCTVPQVVVSPRDLQMMPAPGGLVVSLPADQQDAEPGIGAEHARPEIGTEYSGPESEAERIMAEIWQQVLGISQVGTKDNFFELGGDSVIAIQIIAKANKAGFRLAANHIFEHQTVAELAAAGWLTPDEASRPEQVLKEQSPDASAERDRGIGSSSNDFDWDEADQDAIANAIKRSLGDV